MGGKIPYAILGRDPAKWPDVSQTAPDGIIAIGGDLTSRRLLEAYRRGIFPWFDESLPILWHCPDPRFALELSAVHVPRSLAKLARRQPFRLTFDTSFQRVIEACAQTPRPGQDGTWITGDMRDAYLELHHLGYAHSSEAWDGEELVGGVYGVCLGGVFFGESMFAHRSDASKIAFLSLVEKLRTLGVALIDCQAETDHLRRFGATMWPRPVFLERLAALLEQVPTRLGSWAARE